MTLELLSGLKHKHIRVFVAITQHDFTNKGQETERYWTYADEHLWKGSSGVLWDVDWWNDPVSLLPPQITRSRGLSWRKPDDNFLCPGVLLSLCHVITCHFL